MAYDQLVYFTYLNKAKTIYVSVYNVSFQNKIIGLVDQKLLILVFYHERL